MKSIRPALGKFVLHTFLWLPVCFAAWYAAAPYQTKVTAWLARLMIDQFKVGLISDMEQQGTQLLFVTSLKVYPMPGQVALLLPEVNPLIYSFGLALFLALMLASRADWWRIVAGAALLFLPQSFGVAFDFLAQVGIKFGPEISAQTGIMRWQLEAIALCYQMGFLIFPTLVPVMLWASLCRRHVAELTVQRTPAAGAIGPPQAAEYNIALPKQESTHESQRFAQQGHVQVGRPLSP